ncbi:unnamed protein product [Meganyctiphanes norvegica]|uniref:Neurotransmitter-gated ion-channel ligand-binding domain-containing protein n=1 Tax=Meganyctiphanes norvegica TaxID=48144 RepID=A0AAV2S2R2_MEGNR
MSDESSRCDTLLPPPSSYFKNNCPIQNPFIGLYVEFDHIEQINLEQNQFRVKINFSIAWADPQITFAHLKKWKESILNNLISDIWQPILSFDSASFGDNMNMMNNEGAVFNYATISSEEGVSSVSNSEEVLLTSGSNITIFKRTIYVFSITCSYDFLYFPFDIQECDIPLKLANFGICQPKWNLGDNFIYVNATPKLNTISMYEISDIRFDYDKSVSEVKIITLKLLIRRASQTYLLTTFLPCSSLCILGQMTLTHFSIDNFSDRITVSVSLLIVIASLFSQVSSNLPSSDEFKFVDIFFFYAMLKLCIVYVIHAIIEKNVKKVTNNSVCDIVKGYRKKNSIDMNNIWSSNPQKDCSEETLHKVKLINDIGHYILLIIDVIALSLSLYFIITNNNYIEHNFKNFNITK